MTASLSRNEFAFASDHASSYEADDSPTTRHVGAVVAIVA